MPINSRGVFLGFLVFNLAISVRLPAAEPTTRKAAPFDGFAAVHHSKNSDGQSAGDGVLIGKLDAGGKLTTHFVKSDQVAQLHALGVEDGQLLLNYGPCTTLYLATEEFHQHVNLFYSETMLAVQNDVRSRGDLLPIWKQAGMKAPNPMELTLHIRNTKTGSDDVVMEHVDYSEPLTCSIVFSPPIAWVDDGHLIMLEDEQGGSAFAGGDYRVMVVDVATKSSRQIGLVKSGFWDIVAPVGSHGDVVLIGQKTWVASVDAIASGTGKLEERPARWGQFTISGTIRTDGLGSGNSLYVDGLSLGDKKLSGPAFVTVSADGERALWRTGDASNFTMDDAGNDVIPPASKQPNPTVNFCDSKNGSIAVLGPADSLDLPVWISSNDTDRVYSAMSLPDFAR